MHSTHPFCCGVFGAVNSNVIPRPSFLQATSTVVPPWIAKFDAAYLCALFLFQFLGKRYMAGRSLFCFEKQLKHISECSFKNNSQWHLPGTPLYKYSGEDISNIYVHQGACPFCLGSSLYCSGVPYCHCAMLAFWNFPTSFIPKTLVVSFVIYSFG